LRPTKPAPPLTNIVIILQSLVDAAVPGAPHAHDSACATGGTA
jgi:hypothetical protein